MKDLAQGTSAHAAFGQRFLAEPLEDLDVRPARLTDVFVGGHAAIIGSAPAPSRRRSVGAWKTVGLASVNTPFGLVFQIHAWSSHAVSFWNTPDLARQAARFGASVTEALGRDVAVVYEGVADPREPVPARALRHVEQELRPGRIEHVVPDPEVGHV